MEMDERIQDALRRTSVVRPPRNSLATFGTTSVSYHLITEISEMVNVVREGRVVAEKPRIVTAGYLVSLEGFSEPARRFIETMAREFPREPAVFYRYKNETSQMEVVTEPVTQIIDNIGARLDSSNDPLSAIIKGVEELWDVSLTYELTRRSLSSNIAELRSRGMFEMDEAGLPAEARSRIEEMFARAANDRAYAPVLARELHQWGVFERYQDRFFALFHRG